jgi:hypothetical protein
MLAVIFGVLALMMAWMALFDHPCIEEEARPLRSILVPVFVLMAVAGATVVLMPHGTSIMWRLWPAMAGVALSGIIYSGGLFLLRHRKKSPLRFLVGVCASLAFAVPILLKSGSVDRGEHVSSGGTQFLLIILFITLTIILWLRRFQQAYGTARMSAVTSLVFLACTGIASVSSLPRTGDDASLRWLFTAPGLLVAGAVLFLTCVAVLRASRTRL